MRELRRFSNFSPSRVSQVQQSPAPSPPRARAVDWRCIDLSGRLAAVGLAPAEARASNEGNRKVERSMSPEERNETDRLIQLARQKPHHPRFCCCSFPLVAS
jgi:hypothetical protein